MLGERKREKTEGLWKRKRDRTREMVEKGKRDY